MTIVLIAGGTGMLGGLVAGHLLDQKGAQVRLLVRDSARTEGERASQLAKLVAKGAEVVMGDLADHESLAAATAGVDVVISAVQGGRDIIVDGQVALARAAAANQVKRFFASDYALNLFEAPVGAPQFDLRREADAAIDALPMEVVHVLNGAFMDMMLDPATAGIVDLQTKAARLWGTGDERFNLTMVDDTARFIALLATDPDDVSGVRMVSGAVTSFNEIVARTEELTGLSISRTVMGSADDLRRITTDADDPWSVIMQWYFLSMITVEPFPGSDNDRYPELKLTSLDVYLTRAHQAQRNA